MTTVPVLAALKKIKGPVFTTADAAACGMGTASNATQALNRLAAKGAVVKIARGIWGLALGGAGLSPYSAIPFLLRGHRVYVSFLSALHLYGIVEQIPQTIMLATTGHTRVIRTKLGVFYLHRIAPAFFKGFDWYKGSGDFLIAEPEKALVDCLYLSARRKKQFGFFPELHFSRAFDFKKATQWARQIPDVKIRTSVLRKLSLFPHRRLRVAGFFKG